MNGTTPKLPIIIIGGGMAGLALAQALKQADVPFEIYERDSALETEKGGGWALTIHWSLPAFEKCLPEVLFDRLKAIQVDPERGVKDTGRFVFLDLATAQPMFTIPPTQRMRVNRKLLRSLLAEDIDIQYKKNMASFEMPSKDLDTVEVKFSDGTKTRGSLLIGTDGRSSKTRRLLVGEEEGKLNFLPARSIGVTTRMTAEQIRPLRQIDPLLFQGSHPDTGVYMWFSLVSTPEINGSVNSSNPYFEGQLIQSWNYKSEADEVPSTDSERLAKMKSNAQYFETRLRTVITSLPSDTKALDIKLADWPPAKWPRHNGRITLAGDAAHAMTSYRGEAFNHGIADAAVLSKNIIDAWQSTEVFDSVESALQSYEDEMRDRTHDAVLLSRQACLEAHDLNALHSESPLVSKRAKLVKQGGLSE